MSGRTPAQVWPVSSFVIEEMEARDWTIDDLHRELGGDPVTCCAVDLLLAVDDKNLILDEETAQSLGRAFNVSGRYFINLDRIWRGLQPLRGDS